MQIVDAAKKPLPCLSALPAAAQDNCGNWQLAGGDFECSLLCLRSVYMPLFVPLHLFLNHLCVLNM